MNEQDVELLKHLGYTKEHVIESIFTSSLKPQTEHISRAELGIPENKFLMIVVGARLDSEVSDEFMTNADVPTLAVSDLIDHPTNPFTGKRISSDEKYAHPQRITTSRLWSLDENHGNVFDTSDGEWYDVKDNIFDSANWLLVE